MMKAGQAKNRGKKMGRGAEVTGPIFYPRFFAHPSLSVVEVSRRYRFARSPHILKP